MPTSYRYDANAQTKVDMAEARRATTFDTTLVRNFLHNGSAQWTTHEKVVKTMISDPAFDKSSRLYMSGSERYRRALAMTDRINELAVQHNWTSADRDLAINLLDENIPMKLHTIAFEPVFNSQGSPELAKYRTLIANQGILGCYLQTELGHGTNVSSLETTATFIPDTQEFEIHSPTLTASKWWIGALGKTSTHGVVQAQLILPGGKNMGPHLFFVQLRSLDDHKVLPGITIGDIGPKALAGYAATDNGYAMFDHVRIPKENMLSKFAQVTSEGKYVQPPHAKLSYGGMLYIRSNMIIGAGWLMAKAATVSIRYATVRRQGKKGADGKERQIITYPSVHYRLLPILSHAYVFILVGRNLLKSFEMMSSQLASGDTSLLAEVHAIASGLKVLASATGVQDLEVARRAMGGHGYSAYSGLGRLYADYLPSVTYEGDNFVLDQQVVRAALKSLQSLLSTASPSAKDLPPSSIYLHVLLQPGSKPPTVADDAWREASTSVTLLQWRAALLVKERASCRDSPDASQDQRVSKAVTEAFVAAQVGELVRESPFGGREKGVVADLFMLYLLTTVEGGLADILSFGLLSAPTGAKAGEDVTRGLRAAIADLCTTLLPHAIGLTDAFGFTDWELDSALGVYDGDVYERLYEAAQQEPLNQTEVPAGYEEFIKPMLQRGQRLSGKDLSKL